MKYIEEDGLELNIQSYAAIFECLGNLKHSNRTKQVRYFYKQMTERGITMDDLMNEANFIGDQREVVLSGNKSVFFIFFT